MIGYIVAFLLLTVLFINDETFGDKKFWWVLEPSHKRTGCTKDCKPKLSLTERGHAYYYGSIVGLGFITWLYWPRRK